MLQFHSNYGSKEKKERHEEYSEFRAVPIRCILRRNWKDDKSQTDR